jgi:hypothetical protein
MVKCEARKSTRVNIWNGGSSQCRRGLANPRRFVGWCAGGQWTTLNNTDNTFAFSVSYMRNLMLTAYLSMNHWIVVAIVPKQLKVYYLDSLKTINTDTDPFERIVNE